MMEADYKLETLLGPEKDVDLPQPPSFPVEDAPLVSFSPFRQIPPLLLLSPATQILHFKRQINPPMYVLQRSFPLQSEPGSQDRLFIDTSGQRLLEASSLPGTLHMVSREVVVDSAELLQLSVKDHPRLQRRHRIRILIALLHRPGAFFFRQQSKRLQLARLQRLSRSLGVRRQPFDRLVLENILEDRKSTRLNSS